MKKMILMAVLLVASATVAQAQLKREYSKATTGSSSPVFSTTASPDIPMSVTFAGERVSFDRLDMAERLDRELTSIIYGQTTTELCFKRANRYFPVLAKILKEQGVPLDFLYLAVTESSMDYNAYSSAKAAGMWQLLAGTGRDYGLEVTDEVDERYDPEKSLLTRNTVTGLPSLRVTMLVWEKSPVNYPSSGWTTLLTCIWYRKRHVTFSASSPISC